MGRAGGGSDTSGGVDGGNVSEGEGGGEDVRGGEKGDCGRRGHGKVRGMIQMILSIGFE
jgi:hypothetical protein